MVGIVFRLECWFWREIGWLNSYVTVGLFNCCQMEVYIDMIVPVVEEWYERFMEVMNTEVQIDESGSLDFLPSTVGSYLVVLLGVFCFSVMWSIVLAQFQKPKQCKLVRPKSKSRATKNAPAKKAERCTSGMLSSIEETDIPTQTEISEDSFSVDSELTETETETEYSEFYNDYADESTIEESLHNETGEFRDEDQETSLEADERASLLDCSAKAFNESEGLPLRNMASPTGVPIDGGRFVSRCFKPKLRGPQNF